MLLKQLEQQREKLCGSDIPQVRIMISSVILSPQADKIRIVYDHARNTHICPKTEASIGEDLYMAAYREAIEQTGDENIYPISQKALSLTELPVKEDMKDGKGSALRRHYLLTFGFICAEKKKAKIESDKNNRAQWVEIEMLSRHCKEETLLPIYEDSIRRIRHLNAQKSRNYQQLADLLLPWYEENARDLPWRHDHNPYHIWLSEIMLQQTRVETVIDYYNRFMAAFPTIDALSCADEEKVLKLWEGLGYYSRARNLHRTAKIIMSQHEGSFPTRQAEILKLPGIGNYTAGAILSIAFQQPVPAVDGNVLRVIARITEDYRFIDEERVKKEIGNNLAEVYPENQCGDFTQSLMELGATVCLPNGRPLCEQCPVAEICMANQSNVYNLLPVRKEKPPRKTQELTVFVFICGDRIALQKRKEKGVLQGMWELPNTAGILEGDEALCQAMAWSNMKCEIKRIKNAHHIFTHIEWQMKCYYISCTNTFGDYLWADAEALEKEYSLPTAFKKLLSPGVMGGK